jgi:hypothetical protein
MKKISVFIVSLFIGVSAYPNDTVKNCRDYYYGVCLNEIALEDFNEYLSLHQENPDVVIKGYLSVMWFLKADHYLNPIQKWKCFKKGQEELEKLIKVNSKNTELRFLRLTIQDNIPGFLGYSANKKEDKLFIYKHLNQVSDKDLHQKIVNYLCDKSMTKIK